MATAHSKTWIYHQTELRHCLKVRTPYATNPLALRSCSSTIPIPWYFIHYCYNIRENGLKTKNLLQYYSSEWISNIPLPTNDDSEAMILPRGVSTNVMSVFVGRVGFLVVPN